MRISAKAEYACLAMGVLAQASNRMPVPLKLIAEDYGISHPFLMQIFLQLKGGGLVQSVRGASGGYQLARAPGAIRVSEIVELIDGRAQARSALSDLNPRPMIDALRSLWKEADAAEAAILDSVTLADLLDRCRSHPTMDYQI